MLVRIADRWVSFNSLYSSLDIHRHIFAEWTATEKELRENPTGKVIYYQEVEPNPSLRGKQVYQKL